MILIWNKAKNQFEDVTDKIALIQEETKKYTVKYEGNDTPYTYDKKRIKVLDKIKDLPIDGRIITLDDVPLAQVKAVEEFDGFLRFTFERGQVRIYERNRVKTQKICNANPRVKTVLGYIEEMSKATSTNDEGQSFLYDQYQKLSAISEKSVFSGYLQGAPLKKTQPRDNEEPSDKPPIEIPIFPFGFNLSQKKAVETSLSNTLSIIEGPPGTGKTQTILNIIANIVRDSKTVAIVSGNNSATDNVIEKLNKYGYGFNAALLGNAEKRDRFFQEGIQGKPELKKWALNKESRTQALNRLRSCAQALETLLKDQNTIAENKEKKLRLETEQVHFNKAFSGRVIQLAKVSFKKTWTSGSILELIHELKSFEPQKGFRKWFNRAQCLLKFGIYNFSEFEDRQGDLLASLNGLYYEMALGECQKIVDHLSEKLQAQHYETLMKDYIELSQAIYRDALYRNHHKDAKQEYTAKTYKAKFPDFIKDFPIVLSTTHAIRSSIKDNYLFDYLIIDEASQVDLITAGLALASCKNLIIVGDLKQLPQIVSEDTRALSEKLKARFALPPAYDYVEHSILSSLIALYGDEIPRTLLSEHYRCHPQIIRFCNEKFYDNQLIVMTQGGIEDPALKLYKTVPGQHARKNARGWVNQRQIEVIRDEVLPACEGSYEANGSHEPIDYSDYGVIAPYREHVNTFSKLANLPGLEVDTVHKFQGREKKTIIFTTVSNDINAFIDDPNLLNVAVSRAVEQFIVVTSDKLFKMHGTNLGDLMRYMEYNCTQDAIITSSKISVFDLLYSDYSALLKQKMDKAPMVSEFHSERLMYLLIEEVLSEPQFKSFKCVMHVPLNLIVRNIAQLEPDQRKFASNPWTHVDFLLFNRMDKEPVLVVEVDGYAFHQNNTDQLRRDQLKDNILKTIQLPIIRFSTTGSGEKEALRRQLEKIIEGTYQDYEESGLQ